MYLTVKQQVKHLSKDEYRSLKELSHIAKNLANEAIYNIRQHFFNTGSYLNYYDNYKELKNSVNYKLLNSNMAQQILKEVDGSFKSFFKLLQMKKNHEHEGDVSIPHYLDKDGYSTLVIGFVRITDNNKLVIPMSNSFRKNHKRIEISIPPQLTDKHIKEVRIIPKCNASYFEIQYTYEANNIERINLSSHKYISLDTGLNNLITAVTSNGSTFIIDGRYIKSINQWFNKENARLLSIEYKQLHFNGDKKIKVPMTLKRCNLLRNRNNRINDYISKATRYIVNYCISNDIGNIVLGYNPDIKKEANIGKANNQSFTGIPLGKVKDKLAYLSKLYGINLILQEESYTSKASFFDEDEIPTYNKDDNSSCIFSGSRIKRGQYMTSSGTLINADINRSLNILKKALINNTSKADDCRNILNSLCIAGHVDVPKRIRLA